MYQFPSHDPASTGHTANGVVITQGAKTTVYCDGASNYNVEISSSTDAATGIETGTLNNARLSGVALADGSVTITGVETHTANIDLGDNDILNVGAGDDLRISHDGTDSLIRNLTNELKVIGDNITIRSVSQSRSHLKFEHR